MTPCTEPAQRIAVLFKRRFTTHWSEKEALQYEKLVKQGAFRDLGDLTLIEGYYEAERKKKEGGIHRRDLYTFLNNYVGELDRATTWKEENHRYSRTKIDRFRKKERPVSDEEFQRISDLAKREFQRFKNQLR